MTKQGMVFGAFIVAAISMQHGHPIGLAYFVITIAQVACMVHAESVHVSRT